MKIEEKVLSIIQNNIERKLDVALASRLREDLHVDSFGSLMIVNGIEEEFGIEVQNGDFRQLSTVADVVKLLQSKYHCV